MTNVETNSVNSVTPQKASRGVFAFQFPIDRLRVFTEETQESVLERVLGVTVMSMPVNGNPIDGLTMLVGAVSVSLVVLHVNALVKNLAKPNGD